MHFKPDCHPLDTAECPCSTSSTSLSVVWRPPPASTLNGEFLGYEMTYRKASDDNDVEGGGGGEAAAAKKMAINEDMLRVQVGGHEVKVLRKYA